MFQSRTHTCGELRLAHAGEKVTLTGWMENVREVGTNLAFVVLRDFYGTTQIVVENEEMMSVIRPLNKDDIFVWRPKKAGTELKTSLKRKAPIQKLDKIIRR